MHNTTEFEIYLDWVNNFITVAAFAEYYGLTVSQALQLINKYRQE